ncbi:protein kinase [Nocardiopsis exhalans]|uniref:Protein kinase n=1 Tax=Nocardiopsis exhalans TaxID=163604 RepID=A0ABY5DA39_9ACTN|nr:protein kinase [Nocardiopsis exhalans]USY19961.1 protein kinase [Nocardiopsis exhalans]
MFPLHPHDPPSAGPHRLYARLGEDAYARVYLGAAGVEDPVAVKIVRPEYATDPAFRSSFTHEVEAAHGLSSSHVCLVRDADLSGAVPWVAVSRPLGPSLAELIRRDGPLPAEALHPLALALAQGLADLHATRRTHGSLWPDGVLLSSRTALLADPGLEWAISGTEQRAPHPAFAAPEGGATPATDVFSWASTLCFAASGVEGPDGLAKVPLQLRGLIDTCLKRDPRLRPSAHDLVQMLGGPAVPPAWPPVVQSAIDAVADTQRSMLSTAALTPRESPGGDGPPARRRGRLMAAGAGALALAVLATAGTVFAYGRIGGDPEQDPRSTGAGGDEGGGLITEAGCLDGLGFPAPEEPLPEDTRFWDPVFSPDGGVLVATSSSGLTVWDWSAGEEIARPTSDSTFTVDPVFAPVGCTVAAAEAVDYENREYPVRLAYTYDLAAGTSTQHLGAQEGPDDNDRWMLKPVEVNSADFSPDGSRLAVTLTASFGEMSTVVTDTATGEQGEPMAEGLHYGTVFLDDEHFATKDLREVFIWNAGTGEEVNVLQGNSTTRLAAVPGETQVAYLHENRVVISDYITGDEVTSFTRDEFETDDAPLFVHLFVDSGHDRVYTTWQVKSAGGGWYYRNQVWNLSTGEDITEGIEASGGYRTIVPHPDGEVLAAVTVQDSDLVLIDPDTFEIVERLS